MDTDTRDITKGLDVYGSDGNKIGSVAEVWPAGMQSGGYSGSNAGDTGRTDDFSGTLGDESRVAGGPTPQATGSLGDESRVGGPAMGGGTGSLGDESRAGRYNAPGTMGDQATGTTSGTQPMGATPNASPGYPGQGSAMDAGGEIDEVDVVVVEEVPVDMGGFATGQGSAAGGYFEVDQGGILGIGAKHLYVPFSAVQNVVPGDRVVLNCIKDQADASFENKPAFLNATS